MDEEIEKWIKKKKSEIEVMGSYSGKSEERKEQTISKDSPEKIPQTDTAPTKLKDEPIQSEQKTDVSKAVNLPKTPELITTLENIPQPSKPQQEQVPPSEFHSDKMKTNYSNSPLFTRKSKILLALIAIQIPIFLLVYFYIIPMISA